MIDCDLVGTAYGKYGYCGRYYEVGAVKNDLHEIVETKNSIH